MIPHHLLTKILYNTDIVTKNRSASMKNYPATPEITQFLQKYYKDTNFILETVKSDASARKYYRVHTSNQERAILMDDNNQNSTIHKFIKIDNILKGINIKVPTIMAADTKNKLLLLEDFGNKDLAMALQANNEITTLKPAIDILIQIYTKASSSPDIRLMDDTFIINDFRLFLDWYMPAVLGVELTKQQRQEFLDLIHELLPMSLQIPPSIVLWDYHANNIMIPDDGDKYGIIDFQDALWGPSVYDLVSLIEDERRNIKESSVKTLKEYFYNNIKKARQAISRKDFEDNYAFLALLRHMRVIGRFTTLITVNQKEQYSRFVPRAIELLEKTLSYPKFKKLKSWLDINLPKKYRITPQSKNIDTAFVLAAGRGKRMRDLTSDTPKPLIAINNKSLIDYNFDRIKDAQIGRVIVNTCYLGDLIKEHLSMYKDFEIIFSDEKEALETGGGIKHALHLLNDKPFFAINSDTFWIDKNFKSVLRRMIDIWNEQKYDIILLLHSMADVFGDNHQGIGDYKINNDNIPERNIDHEDGYPYWFTGVSLLNPCIFRDITKDKFSLTELFDIAQKQKRLGYIINEGILFHVGTPEAVKEAEQMLDKLK